MARGKHKRNFGEKRLRIQNEIDSILERVEKGKQTIKSIADEYNVERSYLSKIVNEKRRERTDVKPLMTKEYIEMMEEIIGRLHGGDEKQYIICKDYHLTPSGLSRKIKRYYELKREEEKRLKRIEQRQMTEFKIPIQWSMSAVISVHAKNLEEAKNKCIYDLDFMEKLRRPRGEYIEGTTMMCEDDEYIEELNKE